MVVRAQRDSGPNPYPARPAGTAPDSLRPSGENAVRLRPTLPPDGTTLVSRARQGACVSIPLLWGCYREDVDEVWKWSSILEKAFAAMEIGQ